jgi:sarcosine oxidase
VSNETSTYVVIGAGLFGAATAWQLAAQGHEVTVLEQATPAHVGGSSHGSARIFRYAYPDPLYARLVVEAKPCWEELERLAGIELVNATGALDFGEQREPAGLARVLEGVGVEHELLDIAAASERWPGFCFDTAVLWHPGAGVIDAQSAVAAMLAQAEKVGASLRSGWSVESVEAHPSGYTLTSTAGDTLVAERVVVCAGGWLPELRDRLSLPQGFASRMPALGVSQEQAFHFPYAARGDAADVDTAGQGWPSFVHKSRQIQAYGLPGGRDAGFRGQKVAEFGGGRLLPGASSQDGVVDPTNRRRVTAYVEEHLPGLVSEPYAETTCLFTSTPDQNFVIDRADGITVVSACSGHGAKFAPLLGAMVADLASQPHDRPDSAVVPLEFRLQA